MNETRVLLRHTVATVAYRATRAIERADDAFGTYSGAGKTPVEILAHMGDLFDWALSMVEGRQAWHNSKPLQWEAEKQRFYHALTAFDSYLASDAELHGSVERLFQGPVADALTHVGQLAMLRRLAGTPTKGENFYVAEIETGKVSGEQPPAVRNF